VSEVGGYGFGDGVGIVGQQSFEAPQVLQAFRQLGVGVGPAGVALQLEDALRFGLRRFDVPAFQLLCHESPCAVG